MKNYIKYLKAKKYLVAHIKEQNLHIEHLKRRLAIYEKRDDDIKKLQREKDELSNKVIEINSKMMALQHDKIIDLQNQREIEEANERLEEKIEVLNDIIKGSKTIGTARKEADKLKDVE